METESSKNKENEILELFTNCNKLLSVEEFNEIKFNLFLLNSNWFFKIFYKEISNPSNIKIISSYAFNNCKNLTKVEIQPNFSLQTIELHAFSFSTIDEIFVPQTLSQIGEFAFYCCFNLSKFDIPINSNFQNNW